MAGTPFTSHATDAVALNRNITPVPECKVYPALQDGKQVDCVRVSLLDPAAVWLRCQQEAEQWVKDAQSGKPLTRPDAINRRINSAYAFLWLKDKRFQWAGLAAFASKQYHRIAGLACLIPAAIWWHSRAPEPTVLSFRLGQIFEQVVKDSTYPALNRSNRPRDDWDGNKFGATWVTEPSVIIRFTDPRHGFTLPPTKFAVLTFSENQAVSLATSPMLDPLPFDKAVAILEDLQNQLKAGGWEPWEKDDSSWFDLTPQGKQRLYARMFESGYLQQTTLRIPRCTA